MGERLQFVPNSEVFKIKGCGKHCFRDKTDIFMEIVYNFLKTL